MNKFTLPEHLLDNIDMEKAKSLICRLIEEIRANGAVGEQRLSTLIAQANKGVSDEFSIGKKHLRSVLETMEGTLDDVSDEVMSVLKETIKMKPSRTVSGVATVSLLTRPQTCWGNCVFCPNDLRMPKSYLYDEPACMRAERCFFDPYLQTIARMKMLSNMGHDVEKVEILILGSTWHSYPEDYRIWFIEQVFEAVNDFGLSVSAEKSALRRLLYEKAGFHADQDLLEREYAEIQNKVSSHVLSYNEGFELLYRGSGKVAQRWLAVRSFQTSKFEELETEQLKNETAQHRIVGLSIETRPDALTPFALEQLRRLGVTKIQLGIQSVDEGILSALGRNLTLSDMEKGVELARAYGFKLHLHFMANLPGSDVESDKRDFANFLTGNVFCPDELKIYPCALLDGTELMKYYEGGKWVPYSQDELEEVLEYDLSLVHPYTRITRVIRDFCTDDIVAGNKTVNMRQIVSDNMEKKTGKRPVDIRTREVKKMTVDVDALKLDEIEYATSNTQEVFLQFVDEYDHIAGFLRLSIPDKDYLDDMRAEYPKFSIEDDCAMIREIHVYGNVSQLGKDTGNVQHRGLGKKLVRRACELARKAGCSKMRVISSVGTRKYYENLGFEMDGLYQAIKL